MPSGLSSTRFTKGDCVVTTNDNQRDGLDQSTIAIRSGRVHDPRALAPTLSTSTTWVSDSLDAARAAAVVPRSDRFYARYANPTVGDFEDAVAALEGAESALAFGSGMGAVATVVLGLCSSGDHIVAQRQTYGGTMLLLQGVCPRFGIEVTFVDGTAPGAFAAAIRPGRTMLVIAETPANPQLDIVDLSELGALRGPITVVDSSLATPALQRPLDHGVSLVLHSATKGIGGHNDATLGVIAGERELIESLWTYSVLHGAVASPFDAMNGLRGIRTLAVRIQRQCATAMTIARFLEKHPAVAKVSYPGLESHPQHELASRQMSAFGTVVAVDLADGIEGARRFVEGVRIAQMATSLGGPETLVTAPALTTHAGLTVDELRDSGITPGSVRISVGLEHADDLIADVARALGASSQ
jgi:cystathionine beta-lyase/cystathionine gamma-synthase